LIRTRLDAPIVLAHGLFGFRRIGLGKFTITAYFRGIPEALRAAGNRVAVTRVPAIAGVKLRAKVLAEQIDLAFPGQPVHLIGHSMGGLDARQLVADPAWAARVLSLSTIGTPHLGSAIADCARLRVGPVYRLLRTLGVEHRGFHDLTRRAARAVNRKGFSPEGVLCYCVAGDPEFDDLFWALRPFYEILDGLEGPNDGLVSVESALAFGQPLPKWPVDHFRQMNWHTTPRGPSSTASILQLFDAVLANLADQGFGSVAPEGDAALPSRKRRPPSVLDALQGRAWFGRPVEKNGHGHVAEDVGGGPAAVEEPVDGDQHRDLVGRQADGREDQG
jgi:triacylglycerol lipase